MTTEAPVKSFELLIPGLLQRDPAVEETFYRLAYSRLMAWAQGRFNVRHDQREDFALEVIEKVLRRLERFQAERGNFVSWMYALARNHRFDQLRKEREGRDPLHEAIGTDALDWLETPNANSSQSSGPRDAALVLAYRGRLARLPPEDLEFLELISTSTLTSAEVASIVGMSASAVRKRKERLLKLLHSQS